MTGSRDGNTPLRHSSQSVILKTSADSLPIPRNNWFLLNVMPITLRGCYFGYR